MSIHNYTFSIPELPWHTDNKPFGWRQDDWDEYCREYQQLLWEEEEELRRWSELYYEENQG
jgi:hypothetical protein